MEKHTDKRSTTSRENAKKSTGPKTPEGKQVSSRNAFKHGYYMQTAIMPGENQERFHEFLNDHMEAFLPTNPVEMDLVESIALTKWRLNRINSAENNLVNAQLKRLEPEFAEKYETVNPAEFWGMGVLRLEQENQAITLLGRMESRLRRQYLTYINTLLNLRKNLPTSDVPYDIQPAEPTSQAPTEEPVSPSEPGVQPHPAAKKEGTNLILLQPVQNTEPASQPKSQETGPSPQPRVQTAASGRL